MLPVHVDPQVRCPPEPLPALLARVRALAGVRQRVRGQQRRRHEPEVAHGACVPGAAAVAQPAVVLELGGGGEGLGAVLAGVIAVEGFRQLALELN